MTAPDPFWRVPFPRVTVAQWRERAEERSGDQGLESLSRRTPDGLSVQPLYTVENRPRTIWPRLELAAGGPSLCTVVEAADPAEAGEQIGEDLTSGADGVWLRLDRTARLGREPSSPETRPDDEGVQIHHGTDLALVLDGIPGEDGAPECRLWLDAGANALPWAALWLADRQRCGRDPAATAVHFGADPLAALARDGALPRDLMKLASEMAALVRFCVGHLPGSSAVGVSTALYHEAGATPGQELGFMVATLLEYIRRLGESGLSPADVAPFISLRFAVGQQVFPQIAKLRAALYLWRATLGAAGVEDPPAGRLHAVSSLRALTVQEPELNLLRGCEQAFAASCSGADAVSLWGFDRARGPSSSLARRLARNTPLILRHEGHLSRVGDPAAGSFLVESLTRQLAQQGWALAQEIERRGGMARALLTGEVARWVAASWESRASAFARGEAGITGVTDYVLGEAGEAAPSAGETESVAERTGESQSRRLERHRLSWTAAAAPVAYSRDFVVEELVAAAHRGETLRELGERLGGAEGSERTEPLAAGRDAAAFESSSPESVAARDRSPGGGEEE